ncbi:MAG: hypothetical protein N2C14_04880 [Planctomycetales bacterium]
MMVAPGRCAEHDVFRSVRAWLDMLSTNLLRDRADLPPIAPLPSWLLAAWMVATTCVYAAFMIGLVK